MSEQRTVTLSELVRQDPDLNAAAAGSAIAYLVFDTDGDQHLFSDYKVAEEYAREQLDSQASATKYLWQIFPLYAADPLMIWS